MCNEIILKPIGGLGNQMFQAAYAYSLSETLKKSNFNVDLIAYETYKIREFSLNNLMISENFHILKCTNSKLKITTDFYRIYQKILKTVTQQNVLGEFSFNLFKRYNMLYNFDQYFYGVSKKDLNEENDIYIYGYFQSIQYFSEFEESIKQKMRVKKKVTKKEQKILNTIKKKNSVAISIRIGEDYLKSKTLNVCTENYFVKAIKIIEEKRENPCFFVFSDDVQKVKDKMSHIFEGKQVIFIEGFNDYESLRLMYNCQDFIISNSSFSWWGAYLGSYDKKIVLAPNRWHNNFKKQPDIYYEEMTLINF